MKKAIIFDLNGVFIVSPKLSDRFANDFNVPAKEFLPALKEVMSKVRQPNGPSVYEEWRPYLQKWNVLLDETTLLKYWFDSESPDNKMIQLAKELKIAGYKIFVLSNNFRERSRHYTEKFAFMSEIFDGVYYSWQTGFVKPDVQAYENILRKEKLDSSECIYFDDSEKNIEVAQSLGIESYLFDENAIAKIHSQIQVEAEK